MRCACWKWCCHSIFCCYWYKTVWKNNLMWLFNLLTRLCQWYKHAPGLGKVLKSFQVPVQKMRQRSCLSLMVRVGKRWTRVQRWWTQQRLKHFFSVAENDVFVFEDLAAAVRADWAKEKGSCQIQLSAWMMVPDSWYQSCGQCVSKEILASQSSEETTPFCCGQW